MSGRRRFNAPNTAEPIVYFIQSIDGGPVKIGVATDPKRRLVALQNSCPVRLQVLCIMLGGYEMERGLHRLFSAGRLHGEWFSEDTPGLLEYISEQNGRLMEKRPRYEASPRRMDDQLACQDEYLACLQEAAGSSSVRKVLQMERDRIVA